MLNDNLRIAEDNFHGLYLIEGVLYLIEGYKNRKEELWET